MHSAAMVFRLMFFVLVLTSVLALPQPVRAQASDADARSLFVLGQSAFEEGRYAAALGYFQQAYDLSHRPQLLYNIGHAADRLRDDRRALAAFEQFLREVPDSPQHAPTLARVEVLRAAIAREETRDAAAGRVAESDSDSDDEVNDAQGDSSPTLGIVIAGTGGGALALGATFLALGLRDANTVEEAELGSPYSAVEGEYQRASTRITVGSILLGVGVAAGATGIVLALRGRSSDAEPTARQLRVMPNGVVFQQVF